MEKISREDKGVNPVRLAFHSVPLPVEGVNVDLVFFMAQPDGTPEFWNIRFYRDNLNTLTPKELEKTIIWATRVRSLCRDQHDNVEIEVWEGNG